MQWWPYKYRACFAATGRSWHKALFHLVTIIPPLQQRPCWLKCPFTNKLLLTAHACPSSCSLWSFPHCSLKAGNALNSAKAEAKDMEKVLHLLQKPGNSYRNKKQKYHHLPQKQCPTGRNRPFFVLEGQKASERVAQKVRNSISSKAFKMDMVGKERCNVF